MQRMMPPPPEQVQQPLPDALGGPELEAEIEAEVQAEATMDCSVGVEHTAEMHRRVLWRLIGHLVKEHLNVTDP